MFIQPEKSFLFVCICCVLLISSCADEALTPEDEIKAYIASGKEAAENRSHSDVADLISENYKDQKNLDKKKIAGLARAYFFRHKNIHLFTKIDSIDFKDDNQAFVIVYVAMAGSAIVDINTLGSLRARIYRFDLLLEKNEEWLLRQAKWNRAKLKDIL